MVSQPGASSMCMEHYLYTHPHGTGSAMRTNIDIDDDLLAQAQRASGQATKKATVEDALRLLVRVDRQQKLRAMRGRAAWDGDLEEMRSAS